MEISDRLREARAASGKTQEQVAMESHMNVTQYNGYERGRSRPAPATLKRIAPALKTTVEHLLAKPGTQAPILGASYPHRSDVIRRLQSNFREQVATELGLQPDEIGIEIQLLLPKETK